MIEIAFNNVPVLSNAADNKKKRAARGTRKQCQEGRKNSAKIANESPSHKITEYFTVRRSSRKTTKEIEAEKLQDIEHVIKTGSNEKLLQVYTCKVKGRGIRALKNFQKNEFVVEYRGDIIDHKAAKEREERYAEDSNIGSYMYFFKHRDNGWCVDATAETPYKGRLINHSVLRPNLKTKVIDFGNKFHLVFIANRDIQEGEELLYDYGDRTPCTVAKNPWLLNS